MGDYFYLLKAARFKRIRIEGSVVKECCAEQYASVSEEGSCCSIKQIHVFPSTCTRWGHPVYTVVHGCAFHLEKMKGLCVCVCVCVSLLVTLPDRQPHAILEDFSPFGVMQSA